MISDNELTGLARRSSAYLAIALLLIFFIIIMHFFGIEKKEFGVVIFGVNIIYFI